ncbi:hypothetical protein Tco_0115397 [Tanacetum coccineum]
MKNAGKFLKTKSDFDISNDESDGESSIQVANKTDTFVELKYKYQTNFLVNIEKTIKSNIRESRAKVRLVLKIFIVVRLQGHLPCPTSLSESPTQEFEYTSHQYSLNGGEASHLADYDLE